MNDQLFSKIALLPAKIKVLSMLGAFIFAIAATALTYSKGLSDELKIAQDQEIELKTKYKEQYAKAINLDKYKEQLKEIESSFGSLLRQLPNQAEIPNLLAEVNQAATTHGLNIAKFVPSQEVVSEFYAETKVIVQLQGGYHEFGLFTQDVSLLPRIVNIDDVSITGNRDKVATAPLTFDFTVRTYRYLDEAEIKAAQEAAKNNRKKNKKRGA